MPQIREPAVAGLFYPDDPLLLQQQVDRLLAQDDVGPFKGRIYLLRARAYEALVAEIADGGGLGQPRRRLPQPDHLGRADLAVGQVGLEAAPAADRAAVDGAADLDQVRLDPAVGLVGLEAAVVPIEAAKRDHLTRDPLLLGDELLVGVDDVGHDAVAHDVALA